MTKQPTVRKDAQFVRYIERKVRDTIRTYNLCTPEQRIAVAVSGGKDSITCLSLLHKLGYAVEGIHLDAGIGSYTEQNRHMLEAFCQEHEIPLRVITFKEQLSYTLPEIHELLASDSQAPTYSACMICGIFKRYFLNTVAREENYDTIATGHNCDDEAQSFLMNVFRNDFTRAVRQGIRPGIIANDSFIPRIKPLYFIREEEVVRYSQIKKFPVKYGSCPCATDAYRKDYKQMLDGFEQEHPSIKYNIIRFQERMAQHCKQQLVSEQGTTSLSHCSRCDEPTSGTVCRACHLIELITRQSK